MEEYKYYSFLKEFYKDANLDLQKYITTVYRPFYVPIKKIIDNIDSNSKMLDIGTGTGLLLFLAENFVKIRESYGYDSNVDSINIAKKVNKYCHVNFLSKDLENCIYKKINTITLIDVIHHVPTEYKYNFMKNIFENIDKGTDLIIKDLNPKPTWRAIANNITDYISTKSKVSYLSIAEIEFLFEKFNIQIIKKEILYKHVWSHYLIIGKKN